MHQRLKIAKSLQGIFSLHSAAATETYSASLCITIIQKFDAENSARVTLMSKSIQYASTVSLCVHKRDY